MTDITDQELIHLESIQNKLAGSLIKQAKDLGMMKEAKDWVQGGWSRGSATLMDTVNFGVSPQVAKAPINK